MGSVFEYRLLGPVAVECDGVAVPLSGAKQRTLLAALLVDANRVVSGERLIARLWEDDPPANAVGALHSQVTRLRRLLAGKAGSATDPIATRSDGYLLAVPEQALDLDRFNTLALGAEAMVAAGRLQNAVAAYGDALDQWRGEPLGGVLSGSLRREFGAALAERRLAVVEARIDAMLALGRHQEALAELAELTAAHPLRERFWGQYMLALYRSGRQGDALTAYRDVAVLLVEELGIDPGSALRELHRQILAGDPELPLEPTAQPATRVNHSARAVPRQLPGAVRHFAGRAAELKVLSELLPKSAAGGPVVISAIGGIAGIGKTALAMHFAHQVAAYFPDGQLYADLRGFDPSGTPTDPLDIMRGFLDALGTPAQLIPDDPNDRAALLRSELAERRMPIALDNARDVEQVRPLLPGSPCCLVLVTSRNQLGGLVALDGAVPLTLDVLTADEARDLLIRRLGHDRVRADEQAVTQLIRLCAGLPLALNIAAAHAAIRPNRPLSALVDELRDARSRLDILTIGDGAADVRAVFSWSYDALSPEAARVFRLLGLHPGPDISLSAAASLVALDLDDTRRVLDELTAAHLLTEHVPGRYSFHDLLRAYAAEQAQAYDNETERQAAQQRMYDFYLYTTYAAVRFLDPHLAPAPLDSPAPGARPHPIADESAALAWFDAEHANLLAAVRAATAHAEHAIVWQLARNLTYFHHRREHRHEDLFVWQVALQAAEHLPDPIARIVSHRRLGRAYAKLGHHQDGIGHLQQSLALAEHHHDLTQQAHTHRQIEWAWARRGDDRQGLRHATLALDLFRTVNLPAGEADALNLVGWHNARLGHYDVARAHCQSALALIRQHGIHDSEAPTLDSLGYIEHHTGHYRQAIDYYRQALDVLAHYRYAYHSTNVLEHLGTAHAALGEHEQAREVWRQVLTLYQEQELTEDVERARRQLDEIK